MKTKTTLMTGTLALLGLLLAPISSLARDITPPSTPAKLYAWVVEPGDHVYLKWELAHDDVGVAGYRLYRNYDLIATTYKNYYLDMEYERGEYNVYSVTAIDAAGNESQPSQTIESPANSD